MKIFINEEISNQLYERIAKDIYLNENISKEKSIVLFINSTGGSVRALKNIIDALKSTNKKIVTVNTGIARSSAAILFLQGTERLMLQHSELIYHEPSIKSIKNVTYSCSDILTLGESAKKDLDFFVDEIARVSSGLSRDSILNRLVPNKEFILNIDQALDFCIATAVFTDISALPNYF